MWAFYRFNPVVLFHPTIISLILYVRLAKFVLCWFCKHPSLCFVPANITLKFVETATMEEDQYCTHIYIYLLIINGTIKTNATYQRGGERRRKKWVCYILVAGQMESDRRRHQSPPAYS